METKNREKLLLIATGVVAALWLLNLLVISPLIDSWHDRSREIVKLKENIANGVTLVRRESAIRDRWDEMRANALANNPTVAERQLFTAFDHWVSSGGVTEGSFRPQVQEGDTNYTTVDCRSDVSGNLESVRDFVRAMSQDPLADKVESFELSSKDDNGRQLALGLSLSGLILTDSDPTSVTPAPKPADLAPSQDTNSASNSDLDPFRLIARNNIFDQSRVYRTERPPGYRPPVHKIETISFDGAFFDNGQAAGWFEGTGVHAADWYKVGDSIDDLKIAKYTLKTVTLTNAASNTYVLPADSSQSLRREDDGPWRPSEYVADVPAPDTNSTASTSTAAASAGGKTSVEEMLRKRREEAEK